MLWILYLILFVLLASMAYAAFSAAPWVPTRKADLDRLTKLLDLKKDEKFIELGCGNGRVCRYVAKSTQADVTGLELSMPQWINAFIQNRMQPLTNNRLKFGDLYKHDLSEYDAIYMFLMPNVYEKLAPRFKRELKPGTKVVSYVWPIPGWSPAKISKGDDTPDFYLYKI